MTDVKVEWLRAERPVIPDRMGYYWVNLDREPGRTRLFFFSPGEGERGWHTDKQSDGSASPDWVNTQTPLLELFGYPRYYAKADLPKCPYLDAPTFEKPK